ncbi:MAG TPA: hypothetical protein PKB03_00475 [Baekduia sp.]|nr:hypothetical protein [Baekduia sp.]
MSSFDLTHPAGLRPVALCTALVFALSVLASIGCGGDAQADITKDTSCRDYINAPSDVRHDAAIRISIDVGASNPGNPMWALTADAACGSNPDATVGAAVGGGRSAAETTTQAQPTTASSDEEQVRNVMQRWAAATEPAEVCSLLTPEGQQAEVSKHSGASTCVQAVGVRRAVSLSSMDVTVEDNPQQAFVEVSDDPPLYLLRKVDGSWLIDRYGDQTEIPAPGFGALEPESCGADTGTPC